MMALAFNSRLLNSFLMLLPTVITTVYGPITGQSPFALATTGSVSARIQYMILFTAPFVVGFLGALNRRKLDGEKIGLRSSFSATSCVAIIVVVVALEMISVFLQSPVNGQGQSIYVPAFASILGLTSILVMRSSLVSIDDARRALELIMLSIYVFLLLNIFLDFVVWDAELEFFQSKQLDEFRFSPFAEVLGIPGRESYFETDPQSFGVYSSLALSILITSKNAMIKVTGATVVFIVGSTSQSRLFYLALGIMLVLKVAQFSTNHFSAMISRVFFLAVMSMYFYLLVLRSPGEYAGSLSSFSGRTGVWEAVLGHWNDESILFGYVGVYSLSDYSSENSGRFIFYHAHNLILQYLWDWGIVGVVLILGFFASLFFGSRYLLPEAWFLSLTLVLTGLIEVTLPNTLLSSKFVFILLLVKYMCSPVYREPTRKLAINGET